jgi:hypothetical protein
VKGDEVSARIDNRDRDRPAVALGLGLRRRQYSLRAFRTQHQSADYVLSMSPGMRADDEHEQEGESNCEYAHGVLRLVNGGGTVEQEQTTGGCFITSPQRLISGAWRPLDAEEFLIRGGSHVLCKQCLAAGADG